MDRYNGSKQADVADFMDFMEIQLLL